MIASDCLLGKVTVKVTVADPCDCIRLFDKQSYQELSSVVKMSPSKPDDVISKCKKREAVNTI